MRWRWGRAAEWNGVRKESYLINKLLINVNRFRGGRTRAVFKCIAIWWWLQQSRHTARKEELMDARAERWVQCVITWKASNNSWNCNYDAPQCAREDFSFHLNINTLHHHVCTKLHIPFFADARDMICTPLVLTTAYAIRLSYAMHNKAVKDDDGRCAQ